MIVVQPLNTSQCEFNLKRRELTVASEVFGGKFPGVIELTSDHTGRKVIFRPVQPGHRLYDEDHWDGEQEVYAPLESLPRVESLVVYHAW